jgi:hypothetical protein
MVVRAILSLQERGGSSLQAIKKYIAANFKLDCDKLSPAISKYLKTAVASGELVETKGKSASSFFQLPAAPAHGRRDASRGPRESKQRAAKAKAILAVKDNLKERRESIHLQPGQRNVHLSLIGRHHRKEARSKRINSG